MLYDQYTDLLIGYILDEQSEELRLQVRAHLDSGCSSCLAELKTLEETIHHLPLALPPHRLPNAVKMRINRSIDLELAEDAFAPQHVSHYKLMKRLGIGGMGEVFLAEDTKLG